MLFSCSSSITNKPSVRMTGQPDYSRLCRLIHDSLSLYADSLPSVITEEIEKGLLIHLSQVYTRIKQWIQESEYDSDSENETVAKPLNVVEGSSLLNSHSDDYRCLTEIIGDLMAVLAVENPYIQHLTSNILLAISELVVSSVCDKCYSRGTIFAAFHIILNSEYDFLLQESGWDEFMHLMCLCLKITIDNSLLSYSEMMRMEPKDSQLDFAVPVMLLKLKLKSANLSIASAIVRVLRNVLKLLKKDFSDQDFKVYLDSICTVISDIMCDLLDNDSVVQHGESVCHSSKCILICRGSAQPKSITIFQANLIQLFCSLLDNDNMMETGAGCLNNQIVVSKISSLIPKLLPWCLGEPENSNNIHIFHYFRHKILMVLIRLSAHIQLECSVLCSWLNLIHEYFQHLLSQPITSPDSEHHDTAEGSPFLLHTVDTKRKTISPYHLQRLAVFLFLRCSFSLISMEVQNSKQCACPDSNSCLTTNLETDSKCCTTRGLLELHRWLQGQLPADIFEDSVMYSERCVSFAISFLQLYMHEDDILFAMLLQLSRVPLHLDRCILQVEVSLVEKSDMFSLISDIFNPIQMFHFFLSEIHYDHQVLLDYLISKDSGAISAEYLLRSLRIICDSWNLFVEFPGTGKAMSFSDQKRRKVSRDSSDLDGLLSTTSVIYDGIPSAEIKCRKGHGCLSSQRITKRLSFKDAKGCLFSLQSSIESLNKKSLFPYNPRVLLRRLRSFQELCQLAV